MTTNKFESVNAALAAIQENNVLTPSIPVSVFVQEAEDLKKWAEVDKDVLIAHGLDWTLVESITERAAVCREAQSVWSREYKSREEAQHEWLRKSPEAFRLRDYLMNAFRYAFRKDRSLLEKVSAIARGNTREDMIQDLNDLAVLGKGNTTLLEAIKFDISNLELAAQTSSQMAEMLAAAKGEKGNYSQNKAIRDRAYTYLKQAVDEIRACGKYAFASNESRQKGYRSEYLRMRYKKSKTEKPDATLNAA